MVLDRAEAVARARALVERADGRVLLGLAGAPGAGKSTLAEEIVAAVPGSVAVGMDGFHLAHQVLTGRGDVAMKGAPGTFDAAGYVALLRRLRDDAARTVWAPQFRRDLEDAVAGATAVEPHHRLVVTEGNYLLLDAEPWRCVPLLCDEVWFVAPPEDVRVAWLVGRHERYGRAADEARRRATTGTDGRNAELVLATAHRADVVVDPTAGPPRR